MLYSYKRKTIANFAEFKAANSEIQPQKSELPEFDTQSKVDLVCIEREKAISKFSFLTFYQADLFARRSKTGRSVCPHCVCRRGPKVDGHSVWIIANSTKTFLVRSFPAPEVQVCSRVRSNWQLTDLLGTCERLTNQRSV